MKKKMLAVAVCVSMCMMAFAGCTSESGGGSDKKAEQTEGKKEESGKVFMTVSNQQNEFMVGMAENFKEVGEAAGYEVQLMDADLDATKQVSQIETAISENAEAILVEPCSVDGLTTDSLVYMPVAMSRRWGKGEVILVSTPLIFTNYGMLDGKNATYIFRLLSQMGKLPIVRTEGYMKETAQVQQSPFRYFLAHEPLRWALYLTMITIILFMIFTAKRRQRVIPVIHEPANKSLEFTELIGTLYFQKKDHADLVRKKFSYLAEELRREIQVDIEEVADDERSFHRIARKTGMDAGEIAKFIREVRPVIYGGRVIDAEQMKVYIDKMNEIINHI